MDSKDQRDLCTSHETSNDKSPQSLDGIVDLENENTDSNAEMTSLEEETNQSSLFTRLKNNKPVLILTSAIAALLLVFAVALFNTHLKETKAYKGVYIENIPVGNLSKVEIIELLNEKIYSVENSKLIKLSYDNQLFSTSFKALNLNLDLQSAANQAIAYGKNGNIFSKLIQRIQLLRQSKNIDINRTVDDSSINQFVISISEKINTQPCNAKISFDGKKFTVVKEIEGIKTEDGKLKELIKNAVVTGNSDDSINIPVVKMAAKIHSSELSKINNKIATFSTHISGSPVRVNNIRVALSYVNKKLLLPGDVFSLNKTLGPRTVEKGYGYAPTIVNKKLVPGLAGGICQVATTVYNTALIAHLKIVERQPHSLPVHYVAPGRDATISGDAVDLKFKNTTDAPIYIQAYVSNGRAVVTFYGSK